MNKQQLLDPELAKALEGMPPLKPTAESLPELRSAMSAFRTSAPEVADVTTEERFILRKDGSSLRLVLYRPETKIRTGALLWLHGGGMIMGAPETNEAQSRLLAHRFSCIVVGVDYRLAPEHPYPAGLDDCYNALLWTHSIAEELSFPANRIAVLGESGGGGLAAGLALLSRDKGKVALSAQFLQYPMLDDRTGTDAQPTAMPNAGEFVWTPENNRFAWGCVLGHEAGSASVPSYAAPGRVEALGGLPPTCIVIGELDLFIAENLRFAQNLVVSGVPLEFHVYPGAYHGFMSFVENAEVSKRVEGDLWGSMEKHFRR